MAKQGANVFFPPAQTFWVFLSQVLCADASCREAVRNFLARRAFRGAAPASPRTGAYCAARARLSLRGLEQLHACAVQRLTREVGQGPRWCARNVKVVDGSSVSMPDTRENQARYPQPTGQKPGCGFPVMRIVALFSLGSGLLLDVAKDALGVHERTLFRRLWGGLEAGDVLLADTGFCSYADVYYLGLRGVDSVMRNQKARKKGLKKIRPLGKGDWLVHWTKSNRCPRWLSIEQWDEVPDHLPVRQIDVTVEVPGFRSTNFVVVTTLLDHRTYSKQAIARLYRLRWAAELYLRDIKSALGMDIVRCKTPDMVEKELWMYIIAYNLIRTLMNQAAQRYATTVDRLSFKGTIATVRQWAPLINCTDDVQSTLRLVETMTHCIARDPVPSRPDRTEPRALKRRPKNYQRMTKPRKLFKETPHRGKKRAA